MAIIFTLGRERKERFESAGGFPFSLVQIKEATSGEEVMGNWNRLLISVILPTLKGFLGYCGWQGTSILPDPNTLGIHESMEIIDRRKYTIGIPVNVYSNMKMYFKMVRPRIEATIPNLWSPGTEPFPQLQPFPAGPIPCVKLLGLLLRFLIVFPIAISIPKPIP